MNRILQHRHVEPIAAAFALMPTGLQHRLQGTHFLTGVDPVFAGLHSYTETFQDGVHPRSYRDTAHVAYPCHQSFPADLRATTVVIPEGVIRVADVIHELGHVLHEQVGFLPDTPAVTAYAETDDMEAFAEAFAAWVLPFGHSYGAAKDRLHQEAPSTMALLSTLAY